MKITLELSAIIEDLKISAEAFESWKSATLTVTAHPDAFLSAGELKKQQKRDAYINENAQAIGGDASNGRRAED